MASLYITEYQRMATDGVGRQTPVGYEPALATQKVTISGVSAQSAAFNTKTTFVRLHTDAICSIVFGSNPTAAVTDPRMPLDAVEYFGVIGGQKVAVITNT
jgi:hypothetical protein